MGSAHKSAGYTVHATEVVVFLVALIAWIPRWDMASPLLLAVVGTIQLALADSQKWVGALHPMFAIVVLALAAALAWRGLRRLT